MKIMFLDESGNHGLSQAKIETEYPVFVLAGCVFDFDYYYSTVEPAVNELKINHFGDDPVILRSYDIRKQKGDFAPFVNLEKRQAFYSDLNDLITRLDFVVLSAAINKPALVTKYVNPDNPYTLCLEFILERAVFQLGRSAEKLIVRVESRETHNDTQLAEVYEGFRRRGDGRYISAEEAKRKIVDLSFNQKRQNVAGQQLSDLIAYPIGRRVIDENKPNPAFEVIKPKLATKNGKYLNCGLKIFP